MRSLQVHIFGLVAQMKERNTDKVEVVGLNPTQPTNTLRTNSGKVSRQDNLWYKFEFR